MTKSSVDVAKSYLKPVAEWRERLIGRCFPVVTFICRITGEEFNKDKSHRYSFIFIHNFWNGIKSNSESYPEFLTSSIILWTKYCLSDGVHLVLLYPRSPVCRCTSLCRIPSHLAGFCCSTAQSEHLSQSRLRWDQSVRDINKDRLV